MTEGEKALGARVFGPALDVDRIRVLASPFPRAFVPGRWFGLDWICWPRASLGADLSTSPLTTRATFVHELVHVWQAQAGTNLLLGKLRAGDGPAAYAYAPVPDCVWDGLNIEQQAMVVEHRYRLEEGGTAPGDRAFYDRVCPF
ncbi:MAG TPA: hypothetical protein VGR32_09675 [Brevundimonas sp.]|uniref:hypothetical protein n=1 Tax=Brevundimonas sp. TaxID=1871086 RepID=UPI002DE3D034|nr:hypothetical protein [Brevundimonas sp.]